MLKNKIVDISAGTQKEVTHSQEEEAAILAEWDKNSQPKSIEEIDAEKDKQVEVELGGDNIRVLTEVFLEKIQDGSINTAMPSDVIAIAKSRRKAEL